MSPHLVDQSHINIQETLFSAVISWSHLWVQKTIVFITDNSTVESAMRSGRSKCSPIMGYIRRLFWLAIENNYVFTAVLIKSEENILADELTHLNQPDSVAIIRCLDSYGLLCCNYIFDYHIPFQKSKGCN